MIALEQERGRPYFVNNDFYENEYTQNVKGKYFCIRERMVSTWEKYYENKANTSNKILYFKEYL